MMFTGYKISIHLVTYNGARWLPHTLRALTELVNQNFFLLIIDNASSDSSVALIEEFLSHNPEIEKHSRVVKNRTNVGFARAHNQALLWTKSDYVFMLNQDVYLDSNYIESALQRMESEEDVAAVTGKLWRWYLQPNEIEQIIDTTGLCIRRNRDVIDRGQGKVDDHQYETATAVFGVSGAAPLYRRAALVAVAVDGQVFDENFISYKEDVDLAWRLQRAGFAAWYEPQAFGWHDRGLTCLSSSTHQVIKNHSRRSQELAIYSWVNHLAILIKNDNWNNIWRDLPLIMWIESKKFFFYLFVRPIVFISGIKRLVSLWSSYLKWRRILNSQLLYKPQIIRKWFV